MTDIEKVREAQDFVTRELQKNGAGRIDTMTWGHGPLDPAAGIYQLTLYRNGDKSIFNFSQHELLDNHGSRYWEKQLREHIGQILSEFTDA